MDFDFAAERSESSFSDLHWHPCRYPSQIPSTVIGRLSEPGDLVIDPFLGSGTTLTEAQRLGRRSVGIDLNPISSIIAQSKVLAIAAEEITGAVARAANSLRLSWDGALKPTVPASVQADKWYTKKTQFDLGKIWTFIRSDRSEITTILDAAFSSILMPACRETRHWGYVCDNSAPKGDYERDVLKLYLERLSAWTRAYRERDDYLLRAGISIQPSSVLTGDAAVNLTSVVAGSVDLIVTSPPYQGVADYVKAQRLSMEWFEFDIEPLRLREIGARSKRHRRQASEDYVSDLRQVFTECRRVLKDAGWAVAIIGESAQRSAVVDRFQEDLEAVGFSVEAVRYRQISQSRRQMPSLNQEAVIFMRPAK